MLCVDEQEPLEKSKLLEILEAMLKEAKEREDRYWQAMDVPNLGVALGERKTLEKVIALVAKLEAGKDN